MNSKNISLVKDIVDFMVKEGTEYTSSSNYIFYPIVIMEKFNVDEQFVDDNQDLIIDELYNREEVLDIEYNDCFDIIFGTNYCPNLCDNYIRL